jgi:hypothetical protein
MLFCYDKNINKSKSKIVSIAELWNTYLLAAACTRRLMRHITFFSDFQGVHASDCSIDTWCVELKTHLNLNDTPRLTTVPAKLQSN